MYHSRRIWRRHLLLRHIGSKYPFFQRPIQSSIQTHSGREGRRGWPRIPVEGSLELQYTCKPWHSTNKEFQQRSWQLQLPSRTHSTPSDRPCPQALVLAFLKRPGVLGSDSRIFGSEPSVVKKIFCGDGDALVTW